MNAQFNKSPTRILRAALATTLLAASSIAQAGFIAYEIRNTPTINNLGGGETEFIIDDGGDKAALGSSDIDGMTLGDIASVRIDRLDDRSRFTPGSGPHTAPYLNFWITDGAGNYAVAANEPSNPAFQPLFSNGYDLSFTDLSDKVAKIYENSDTSWLPNNGSNLTFSDLSGFQIMAPSVSELTSGWGGLGTGAPRSGTNEAYGVNWVFGDTLSNYVSGAPEEGGYVVANAEVSVATVSEPSLLVLTALALFGLGATRPRRASAGK